MDRRKRKLSEPDARLPGRGGELRGRQQNGPVSARKRGAADRPGSAPKSDGREMILKKYEKGIPS